MGKTTKKNVTEIEYIETDERGLDSAGPLWEKLREHHQMRSQHFVSHFSSITFEQRKQGLLGKCAKGSLHIDFAKNRRTGEITGYCISSTYGDCQGEVESIYIDQEYRRLGIGDNLIRKALNWMDSQHVKRKIIVVAAGNEDVFEFYHRYGFYPRVTILEETGLKSVDKT